jgi:NAD-dependent deacetylase sirtuin 5
MSGTDTGGNPNWATFANLLAASSRVLCVVGAGLSAPSGLATWRGSNGLWNNVNLKSLATPGKFDEDPVTVWRFYGERILEALAAQPNAAHHALAALARWHTGWLTINQNVDGMNNSLKSCGRCANSTSGLLERAGHPMLTLVTIHGTLKTVRCTTCDYSIDVHKPEDIPFLLSLSKATDEPGSLALSDLPHCPRCTNLLRPGVVWFGERLAGGAPDNIDEWMEEQPIDLVIAAGTSLEVFPTAEFVATAREYDEAPVAIFDTKRDHGLVGELDANDWFFEGDISIILPGIVEFLRR